MLQFCFTMKWMSRVGHISFLNHLFWRGVDLFSMEAALPYRGAQLSMCMDWLWQKSSSSEWNVAAGCWITNSYLQGIESGQCSGVTQNLDRAPLVTNTMGWPLPVATSSGSAPLIPGWNSSMHPVLGSLTFHVRWLTTPIIMAHNPTLTPIRCLTFQVYLASINRCQCAEQFPSRSWTGSQNGPTGNRTTWPNPLAKIKRLENCSTNVTPN